MFKPTLKRSKIQHLNLQTTAPQHPHAYHATINKIGHKLAASHKSFEIDQSIIFPTSLFEDKVEGQETCIFNPLNYLWTQYPKEIRKSIGQAYEQSAGRRVGCYKNLIWHYKDNRLFVCNNNKRQVFEYQIEQNVDCLQIGQIQSSSLHFKTRNLFIVAIGVANCLLLFGIEKQTFKMSDLKFSHYVVNSRRIQKIQFINQNQLIVASDTCHFCHIDFSSQTKICQKKLTIMEKTLPYMPLLYSSSSTFVEEVLINSNILYALIREQRPANWLGVHTKKTLNFLLLKNEPIEYILQRKRIQVHQINRQTNEIKFMHRIEQQQFIRKLKMKHPQVNQIQDSKALKISNIYIYQIENSNYLSVVTNNGYFVSIYHTESVIIGSKLLKAPRQNNIGIVGIYLQKKSIADDYESKDNQVTISLGLDNLTLMNNCLWYLSENAIEAVKCDRLQGGDIIQIRKDNYEQQKWLVFTKLGYYTITRFTTDKLFLSYLSSNKQMAPNSPEQSTQEGNFILFLQNMSKAIGYDKICQALIECILHEQNEFKISSTLQLMMEEELRGQRNKDFRDWNYALNKNGNVCIIETKGQADRIWKYFLQLQYRSPKRQIRRLHNQNMACSAYWYALRNIFIKYASFLLKVEPKNIKKNKAKIDENIQFLEGLPKFFFLKDKVEKQHFDKSILAQKDQPKLLVAYKSMISHLKPYYLSISRKQEQKTQTSIDQSIPQANDQRNTNANESSGKLENIISTSIKRLKNLITVLMYLVDISESEGIGSIEKIVKFKQERQKIRRLLLSRVQDVSKLKQFSTLLPQLGLIKPLQLNQWIQRHQQTNNPLPNLPQLAFVISSQDFSKIKLIFSERLDLQMDVVLLYWDYLQKDMDAISKVEALWNKQKQVFSQERAFANEENKEYIRSQMASIQAEAHAIINSAINNYINSNHQQYQKSESIINNVIKIITSHHDPNLITYAHQQMANFQLTEKVILLKKHMTKIENPKSSTEILSNKKHKQSKKANQRQFLTSSQLKSTQEQSQQAA